MRQIRSAFAVAALTCAGLVCTGLPCAAQISLGTAIDQALRTSEQVKIAEAEQARARAALSETKDAYVPSLGFTSGLAKGTGFSLGDPSVLKLMAQGLVFNASQPDYIRAAREAWRASQFSLERARQQVVLDVALTYAELDADAREGEALQQQEQASRDMVRVIQDRADSGLESKLASKRAQLRAAQARLKRLDLDARADVLREHLAGLIGQPAASITTDAASIPRFPALVPDADARIAALSSASVQSALEEAKSKRAYAKGQHSVNFRPEIDLLLQYGYISDFNDYSRFYNRELPASNLVAGVAIQLPLWNQAQNAKAHEADAEAVKATHEAALQQSQVSEQILQLRRAVEQTDAAAAVARLQDEIAADNLEALQVREQQGGEVNGASVNPADVAGGQMEELGLKADAVAAEFEHTKAELQWMHAVGSLTAWAQSTLSVSPNPSSVSVSAK